MKRPPVMLAVPRAMSSRFALMGRVTPSLLGSPPPRDFPATEDSKKPRRAMMRAVLMASDAYLRCAVSNGK
jgi:hypothetical protein